MIVSQVFASVTMPLVLLMAHRVGLIAEIIFPQLRGFETLQKRVR